MTPNLPRFHSSNLRTPGTKSTVQPVNRREKAHNIKYVCINIVHTNYKLKLELELELQVQDGATVSSVALWPVISGDESLLIQAREWR